MGKDKFFEYMSHPERLDAVSLENLLEIVREYPYFQTARLLLAKNLKNLGHYRYENELKVAAIYAGNRSILHWLINDLESLNHHVDSSINKEEHYQIDVPMQDQIEDKEDQSIPFDVPFMHSEYQIDVDDKKDFSLKDLLNDINESAKRGKIEEKKNEENKLLDDFITTGPEKIEVHEEPKDKIDHSIAEVRESEGFLSEKLAGIYAKQGHFEKAAGMYLKLADQIPSRKEEFLQKAKELGENKDQ